MDFWGLKITGLSRSLQSFGNVGFKNEVSSLIKSIFKQVEYAVRYQIK